MRYTYSIIDSDKITVEELNRCFTKFPDYSCVGVSGCYDKSLDLILEYTPDVIFINIDSNSENTHINPFSFVNELHMYLKELPHFIGLSVNKELAYTCMKNNFTDYLLKPINSFELRKSISKFSKKNSVISDKLCLKSYKDYRFIEMEEILFLKADNTATDFFMEDGSVVSAFKTLKTFESILPKNFIRIHNSYIINQNYVSRIHFGKSKCTIKKNNFAIPFSKSYKNNVVILEKAISKRALLSLN